MVRRGARRAPEWTDSRLDRERVLIERVIVALRAEGRIVTDVWYPDQVRDDPRVAGRTTPEAALVVDGHPAAIDVTGFWTTDRGTAATYARAISRAALAALEAAELPLCPLAGLVYRPLALAALRDPAARDRDAQQIGEALVAAGRGSRPLDRLRIDPTALPAWVERLSLTTLDRGRWMGRPDVIPLPWRDREDARDTLEAIATRKGRQLAGWGLGIVAILHDFHETADGVAAQLAIRADWPFWRVYWCDAGDVRLVWEAASSDPSRGSALDV